MVLRGGVGVKLVVTAILVLCLIALGMSWVSGGPRFGPSAEAQDGAGEQQYIAPNQQGDGTYVFTVPCDQDIVTTELFDITSDSFTVTSESDPAGYEPFVSAENEAGTPLETEDDELSDIDTYEFTDVAPGSYRLTLFNSLPANVDATCTATVSQSGSAGLDQYDDTSQRSA